ncbi:hypothetical protein CTI12_AA117280 [Artemisia annua]|uniref:RWP-RK domain-containing protein n=1 Tax=Artemisia annua TaxID=35608 RepID=A0A2U1PSG6_ARTAN|nr:hypothetical protein CTI12_AA117280 [Artemisia annua]
MHKPLQLWEENWEVLSEDILHNKRKVFNYPELELTEEKIKNYCLIEIQHLLNRNGRNLADFPDLPRPDPRLLTNLDNRLIREALDFDAKLTANELNVSLSVLKRCGRNMGFMRWPHRKLNSLDLLISTLQAENEGATVDDYTKVIITRLKEERRRVQENPDYKLAPSTKKLRDKSFKARHKRRRNLNLEPTTAIEATPLDAIHPTKNSGSEEMHGDYDTQRNHTTGPSSSPSSKTVSKSLNGAARLMNKEHTVANHVEPLNATPRSTQANHIIGPSSSPSHETLTESSDGAGSPMNKGDDSIPNAMGSIQRK